MIPIVRSKKKMASRGESSRGPRPRRGGGPRRGPPRGGPRRSYRRPARDYPGEFCGWSRNLNTPPNCLLTCITIASYINIIHCSSFRDREVG